MIDRENVIKGLECCFDIKKEAKICARDCSYFDSWKNGCVYKLMHDAHELLKADQAELIRQRDTISKYRKADEFLALHGWEWKDD